MSALARDLLWPSNSDILVRIVFLYVGQGESTIVLAADGAAYRSFLVDINCDAERKGIDVPRLMSDLLSGAALDVFVNTHPHNDHLSGVRELADAVAISTVWHSGHKPGKNHEDAYKALQEVINSVKKRGGSEERLAGSRTSRPVGEAECYILAPAQYVSDDIAGEDPDARNRRVHEQCAVLKFGLGSTWVMLTGDADRDAWEKHIAEYHKERLPAVVFSAPHHGSRTFFHYNEDDEPYLDAIRSIAPTYVIISAPQRSDSPHDHPHKDAVELYAEHVGTDNILHTGENRLSFICDIYRDGKCVVTDDKGELADKYPIGGGNGDKGKTTVTGPFFTSRVDDRPMGAST